MNKTILKTKAIWAVVDRNTGELISTESKRKYARETKRSEQGYGVDAVILKYSVGEEVR